VIENKYIKYFFILFLLFIVFFSFSTNLSKRHRGGFLSDESSYFSIIQSLAYDYDIKYDKKDIIRIRKEFIVGPIGFFLKKANNGNLYFAKSFSYPLFAAPFYRFFGTNGLLLFNGLMIFLSILMGFLILKQHFNEIKSFVFSLIFVLATAIPIYIWWITADLFNFFVFFTALFLFFYEFKRKWIFYFSSIFFSFAVFSKLSTIIPVFFVYLILLVRKDFKRFIILSLITILIFSSLVLFYFIQTGEISYKLYMGGDRRTFYGHYPYERPEYKFEDAFKMSADTYWNRLYLSPHLVFMNLFYFFFGRFTGMFIYFFPAILILILFIFQKKSIDDWIIFLGIIFTILFFITITSENYFGGSGSVGNRYFLTLYPLFFFLGFKKRIHKFNLFPAVIALIFLSGTYMDSINRSIFSRMTGINFPINQFPAEKTQYLTLPSNENPRAFGRLIRDSKGNRFYIHFVNDNYWQIEDNYFWTYSTKEAEFFLVSEKRINNFYIEFKNSPVNNNHFSFNFEYNTYNFRLDKNQVIVKRISAVNPLKYKSRYVYYLKLKSKKDYCAYFNDYNSNDKRILGVRFRIQGID